MSSTRLLADTARPDVPERPEIRHHRRDGTFSNPWLADREQHSKGLVKWMIQRVREGLPPLPPPSAFPLAEPELIRPRADTSHSSVTWIGQATFLLQVGGLNVLTDPVMGPRASPFTWAGPKRLSPLPLAVHELPPIDVVLLSHDHYDHLDHKTCKDLNRRSGSTITWVTPLGYRGWLEKRGATRVIELDWWDGANVDDVDLTLVPSQHWTRRGLRSHRRLWGGWVARGPAHAIYFAGDSGYFAGFGEIGARLGPFGASLMPIGAYEPRWFMKTAHMNPEEAVQAYIDMGGTGVFVGMHWGTFRLTDEDVLEPPVRARAAWETAGLATERFWIPRHGETRILRVALD